jgi:hypothetical protein
MLRKRVLGAGLWLGLALPLTAHGQGPQPVVTMQPTSPIVTEEIGTMPQTITMPRSPEGTVTLLPSAPRQATTPPATSPAGPPTTAMPTVLAPNTFLGSCCGSCSILTVESPCGGRSHFWVRAEYLLWGTKEQTLPPLVTTGGTTGVGRFGFDDTQVLYGGRQQEDPRSGFRITAGSWLSVEDPLNGHNRCLGVEGNFFFLGDPSKDFSVSSTGIPILVRPIVNANTGNAGLGQVANPALTIPGLGTLDPLSGSVTIHNTSQFLGGELNGLCRVCQKGNETIEFIGGVRFLSLKETLEIREDLTDLANQQNITVLDTFRTVNRFYGAQVGVRTEHRLGNLALEVTGKLAVGSTRQEVDIDGFTQSRLGNDTVATGRGGLLALEFTNIGKYDRDVISIVPEVTVNASYLFNDNLRVFLGYNFLYWSNVARPGDQIDLVVNPNFVPSLDPLTPPSRQGPARPAFFFRGTDFWAQGLNVGAEWRF